MLKKVVADTQYKGKVCVHTISYWRKICAKKKKKTTVGKIFLLQLHMFLETFFLYLYKVSATCQSTNWKNHSTKEGSQPQLMHAIKKMLTNGLHANSSNQ